MITREHEETVHTILHGYCDDERPGAGTAAFWAAVHYLRDVTTLDSGARQAAIEKIQHKFERTHRCKTT
jgi:hypothetical protein